MTTSVMTKMKPNDLKFQELDNRSGSRIFSAHNPECTKTWVEANLEQKQRLQKALFPAGAYYSDGKFGTAKICLAFQYLQENKAELADLASPAGFAGGWKDFNSFNIQVFFSSA